MKNGIVTKSSAFAMRTVNLYNHLTLNRTEYVMPKQLLRSGAAIAAVVSYAEHGLSNANILNKMNIALKEANGSKYWLFLLTETDYLSVASIVKTTMLNLGRN